MRRPFELPRRVAVTASVLGVVAIVGFSLFVRSYVPSHHWLFGGHYALGVEDLRSRFRDIWRLHHGFNLYSNHDHRQYFTYPPAALFIFWPLWWASFAVDVVWWTALSMFALAGTIAIVWRAAFDHDRWSVAASSLWAALAAVAVFPVISLHIALGQIGLFITVALALDYLVVRGPARGVMTGVAAAIKIYPAVFILVWLWRREWRAAATALVSGLATTVLAWAVWPTATATFVRRQLFSGWELNHFLHNSHWLSSSSSPYTIFFRSPFHGGPAASALGWAASLAGVGVGLWGAQRLWVSGRRASSFVLVLAASVLAGPVTWDHYYTFAPLMLFVVLENWDRRWLESAGILAMVVYAVPWQLARNESLSVHGFGARSVSIFVARNALSVATILVFAAAVYVTRSTREGSEKPIAPGV